MLHAVDSSPPAPPPRWHPILRVVLFLAVFFLLQLGAAFVLGAGIVLARNSSLSTGAAALAVFALTALPLVAATAVFLRLLDRRRLPSIGARWPVGGATAAIRQAALAPAAAVGLLAAWLGLVAAWPGAAVRWAGWNGEITGAAGALRIAGLLAGFLVQGGVEEWLVRGYIYHALRERWRMEIAALASSLLFAALHAANPEISWPALANTFLAGVIFAFVVERTGSLWSAGLAHSAWNFAVSALDLQVSGVRFPHLFALTVTGPAPVSGGGFGPEGSLLLTALALPIAWAAWRAASRDRVYDSEWRSPSS